MSMPGADEPFRSEPLLERRPGTDQLVVDQRREAIGAPDASASARVMLSMAAVTGV